MLLSTLSDDPTAPTVERNLNGHKGPVTALSFNPTTKLLASSSLDNNVMIWDMRLNTRPLRLMGHKDAVMDICFSPSGDLVASASKDRTIRLWAPTVREEFYEMRAHTAAVRSVDFSPDGLQLLTSSDDKICKLWSVARRKFFSSFTGHTNWVRCARFSPEGRIFASCGDDKMVKLFDLQNTQCVHTFQETKGCAFSLVFHPSGTCIGMAMSNNVIKVYDIRTYKILQEYNCRAPANKIAFHPCGNFLISASQDSTIKVLNLLKGRPIYTIETHDGPITAVVFSGNGEYFASGGADHKIIVWRSNFDREELRKKTPVKALQESQLKLDAPVSVQVDARSSASGSNMPDIDVTNVDVPHVVTLDINSSEGIGGDENVPQNEQRSAYGLVPARKSAGPKPNSVHTVCSSPPGTLAVDRGLLAAPVGFGDELVDKVESLVQQVTLLKAIVDEILRDQKLQAAKIVQMDGKFSGMKSIIGSIIDETDDGIKE